MQTDTPGNQWRPSLGPAPHPHLIPPASTQCLESTSWLWPFPGWVSSENMNTSFQNLLRLCQPTDLSVSQWEAPNSAEYHPASCLTLNHQHCVQKKRLGGVGEDSRTTKKPSISEVSTISVWTTSRMDSHSNIRSVPRMEASKRHSNYYFFSSCAFSLFVFSWLEGRYITYTLCRWWNKGSE